jgi:hypothetical protein
MKKSVLLIRIRDPLPFWPLDPGSGMCKESGSGMNNPDLISRSLETIFWVKTLEEIKASYESVPLG